MKYFFLLLTIACFIQQGLAQQTTINSFNQQRQRTDKTGLKILAGYSAANIIYGSIAASQTSGSNKYFHQMNMIWNGVTLSILSVGYLTSGKEGTLSLAETIKKQHGVEKLFLFNTGLDLAYVAGGAYLYEKSKTSNKNPERLKGYGQSVMLQGSVLLVFDAVMFILHNKQGKKLHALLEKLQPAATENGIGISYRL
ncbi:MAG: hypothetical protein H7Y86_11480 [Rhizobacter sp.]|nr:hypothetical protein [Ferruginibacter sp.]